MKAVAALVFFLASAQAEATSPIGKVIQLLSDLQAKVIGEGEQAQKTYAEFSEWCEERSKNVGYEIKTGKSEVAALKATIEQETALIASLTSKVEDLSAGIATDDADLKAAIEIRGKEAAAFATEEKELMDIVNTLERAIGLLEKHGSAFLQSSVRSATSLAEALSVMVKASVFSSADAERLKDLAQGTDDGSFGPPEAAVYEGHSADIVQTLEDLMEKAQAQLDGARKTETASLHNFEMLKQSLEDQIKFDTAEMAATKKALAGAGERKAAAEGDLKVTSDELKADEETFKGLHHTCMTKAQDFEAATKSRDEELKALAEAKKSVTDNTVGADSIAYGLNQVSLLEFSHLQLRSGADLAHFEAVRFVRDLARKQHSPALAQLANRMASAMRVSSGAGQDPFAKVKGLIRDMVTKLEDDAATDASHKAYCDKELAESNVKKSDKTAEIEKLTTEIDMMSARSAQLKEEVAALMKALAELAASQAEMDKIRSEEHTQFVSDKADMEQGLEGVKLALKILTEYFDKEGKAHASADGATGGIIGLLEVVESDFSKGLAGMIATEDSSLAAYEAASKENEINKASKEQDVKYKTKESSDLDKAVSESSSDRATSQTELDAVNEYLGKLDSICSEKAEPYAMKKERREAEIAGLKEALDILNGEAVLLQQKANGRRLRSSFLRPA
jgi:hypothetical protein